MRRGGGGGGVEHTKPSPHRWKKRQEIGALKLELIDSSPLLCGLDAEIAAGPLGRPWSRSAAAAPFQVQIKARSDPELTAAVLAKLTNAQETVIPSPYHKYAHRTLNANRL